MTIYDIPGCRCSLWGVPYGYGILHPDVRIWLPKDHENDGYDGAQCGIGLRRCRDCLAKAGVIW